MFGRLMPHEGRFFELFNEHAELIVQGSRALAALMSHGDDIQNRAYQIESIEKQADKATHAVIEMLHKTFITPLDRDEIHQLITRMDDILDLMEDASQSIFLYDVRTIPEEASKLAEICVACSEQVRIAVGMLSNMDNAKTMGQRITKLKPFQGCCAETGGAFTLFMATGMGIPVSTTHTITGAIVGVGSARGYKAVRWGVAGTIVWAWLFTIPCSAFMAGVAWWIGTHIF